MLKEACFPVVPHLRAGAANVGNRQQIKREQVLFVSHQLRKFAHHIRVCNIPFLRESRHRQVVFDQPGNELYVLGWQANQRAIFARIHHAELRVIATTALGDIVKNARQIQHFALGEFLHELTAQRVLM